METLNYFFAVYMLIWLFLVGFMLNSWVKLARLSKELEKTRRIMSGTNPEEDESG